MASPQENRPGKSRSAAANLIVKEGFLCKKRGVIKSWSRKYFILNRQSLCYFRREQSTSEHLEPMGRIFLSDVVTIQTEGVEKKKSFVFALHTKKRAVLLQAANNEDRDKWVEAIGHALETDNRAEREDPFRKTLRKLKPGLKRITLVKDPAKGIGCTIKAAAGHILVNRIIEDGPIAHTGVLRPGDQILDIHGTSVSGLQVAEVVEIIKKAPDQFLATVRPITALTKGHQADTGNVTYSEIIPQSLPVKETKMAAPSSGARKDALQPVFDKSPTPSLEDVGNYDDEDEGDTPPPLPPRTEDALILVDPPPDQQNGFRQPPLPPKPRDAEELLSLQKKHYSKQTERDRNFLWTPNRPPMQKAKSEEDVVMDERFPERQKRRPPRVHVYDEVQPKLNYVDIRELELGRKDDTLINVELDWKKKVQV